MNILIYGMSSYLIIYMSYKLVNVVLSLAHSIYLPQLSTCFIIITVAHEHHRTLRSFIETTLFHATLDRTTIDVLPSLCRI